MTQREAEWGEERLSRLAGEALGRVEWKKPQKGSIYSVLCVQDVCAKYSQCSMVGGAPEDSRQRAFNNGT